MATTTANSRRVAPSTSDPTARDHDKDSTVAIAEPPRVSNESSSGLTLSNVGVKFRLLTDDQRTIKGNIFGLLGQRPEAAEFWALKNFSLQVSQGDVLGVMGPNGSGKSTLVRVMARIIAPTEGMLEVKGKVSPLLELGAGFNVELTGRENVFLHGALHKFSHEEMTERMPQVQAFADIGPFFDVPLKSYSTGMVSRLAFAIAIQMRPDILLVDEVFSVGDENFQRKSSMKMRKLIDQGVIVVIVTHSHTLIRQVCNRAIWMDRGGLVEDGKPNQVTDSYLRHSSQ